MCIFLVRDPSHLEVERDVQPRLSNESTRGEWECVMSIVSNSSSHTMELVRLEGLAQQFEEEGPAVGLLEPLIRIATRFQPHEHEIVAHLRRTASYVRLLAQQMGLSPGEVATLTVTSVLHDVGMVVVPQTILLQTRALSDVEREVIEQHAEVGWQMLRSSGNALLDRAAEIAYAHHERYDGGGYPRGLCGEEIPLGARLMAVADVFDALTTTSAHKMAYPADVVFDMMCQGAGTRFDPQVIEAMCACADTLFDLCSAPRQGGTSFEMSERDQRSDSVIMALQGHYITCPHCRSVHPSTLWQCPRTQLPLRAVHRLSGTLIRNKYVLKRALGVGGMSVVYEAKHLLTERRVAVKILDAPVDSMALSVQRFVEEARIYTRVGHESLVEVLDIDQMEDGTPYIVMEYLEGSDLETLLEQKGRFSEREAARILIELLKSLCAVHAAGIVHRDLKPANIFIARMPMRLKLLDFGIALGRDPKGSRRRWTCSNSCMGTPTYMSPEQTRSAPDLDPRSDLFSVGTLLYEMVTGEPPFQGSTAMTIMMNISNAQLIPPRDANPDLSTEMAEILCRALSEDREDRFQNTGAFARALIPFCDKEGVQTQVYTAS